MQLGDELRGVVGLIVTDQIDLAVRASDLHIYISTNQITLGEVTVGSDLEGTLTLYNDGHAVLAITEIRRVSGSGDFEYVGPTTPFDIGPGDSQKVTIRFAPISDSHKTATFHVSSNEPDEESIVFEVYGWGAAKGNVPLWIVVSIAGIILIELAGGTVLYQIRHRRKGIQP